MDVEVKLKGIVNEIPTLYFEDFEAGRTYPTRTRKITDEDHAAFCAVTGYRLPLFVDDAYARGRGLPGRICPSHLIMSFSTTMTGDLMGNSVIGLMGIDNARFLKHVRPGDSLRTEVEVLEKRETSKPDRGIVVFRDHVYNQDGIEVFRNDKTVLMRRRPAP